MIITLSGLLSLQQRGTIEAAFAVVNEPTLSYVPDVLLSHFVNEKRLTKYKRYSLAMWISEGRDKLFGWPVSKWDTYLTAFLHDPESFVTKYLINIELMESNFGLMYCKIFVKINCKLAIQFLFIIWVCSQKPHWFCNSSFINLTLSIWYWSDILWRNFQGRLKKLSCTRLTCWLTNLIRKQCSHPSSRFESKIHRWSLEDGSK